MDNYSSKYGNFIPLGDLNSDLTVRDSESGVRDFCEIYSCRNVIKDNTFFKNPLKSFCIDLIIRNRPTSFRNSVTVETGLSDFHKMTLTVMKVFYKKHVKNSIIQMTSKNNDLEFDRFKAALDEAIQRLKWYVRANQAPFINKKINKEIMKRSRLRNKFLDKKSDIDRMTFNKQRKFCVSLVWN